jgi:intein-encoded DNA endonuclease-like protein
MPPKGWSKIGDAGRQEAIQCYLSGKTTTEIGRDLGINPQTVANWVTRAGVAIRPNRKYEVDESVFDVIDSQEKAYWLGFFVADGYSEKKSPRIRFDLAAADRAVVERFAIFLKSNIPVREYHRKDGRHTAYWGVRSRRLMESVEAKRPSDVSQKFHAGFLNGLFDGDGYGGRSKNKYTGGWNWEWSTIVDVMWKDFVKGILRCIGVHVQERPKPGSVFEIRVAGRLQVGRVVRFMYSHGVPRMERKERKFDDQSN